jgi:hypothetical protein
LSADRLMTQLEMMTSTLWPGRGIASMQPPDPRSRTVSPGRSSATATGLPQPRLARTAPLGRPLVSVYPAAPKSPSSASGLQLVTVSPACAAWARVE